MRERKRKKTKQTIDLVQAFWIILVLSKSVNSIRYSKLMKQSQEIVFLSFKKEKFMKKEENRLFGWKKSQSPSTL